MTTLVSPEVNDPLAPYVSPIFSSNPTLTCLQNDILNSPSFSSNQFISKKTTATASEKNEKNAGDPVNLATGEFTYKNTLISIPGVKNPYELQVAYKSQIVYNGPLGYNWDHNYNQYLTGETNGNVLFSNGNLGTFRFILS